MSVMCLIKFRIFLLHVPCSHFTVLYCFFLSVRLTSIVYDSYIFLNLRVSQPLPPPPPFIKVDSMNNIVCAMKIFPGFEICLYVKNRFPMESVTFVLFRVPEKNFCSSVNDL